MAKEGELSRAKELKNKAEELPEEITPEEMQELLKLAQGNAQEARSTAVSAIDQLYTRPALFEPILGELLEMSAYYPYGVEGIPAPVEWTSDDDIREVVFIADAIARVAQRQPELLVSHAEDLTEIVLGDRNSPAFHLFTLGMVGAIEPDTVPLNEVKSKLCALLDTSMNGYAGWAADTLRRIGDPAVLDDLREHAPENPSQAQDDAEITAFDEAITKLEKATSE